MYPLSTVATGLLLVFFDFRINQFDLLLDPLGWVLVVAGLRRMSRAVDPEFKAPMWASVVAGVFSLADVPGSAAPLLLYVVYQALLLVAIWMIATAIMSRARSAGDADVAVSFDRLRWMLVAIAFGGVVAVAVGVAAGILLAILAGLVAYVWLIVRMYRSAKLAYLAIPDAASRGGVG